MAKITRDVGLKRVFMQTGSNNFECELEARWPFYHTVGGISTIGRVVNCLSRITCNNFAILEAEVQADEKTPFSPFLEINSLGQKTLLNQQSPRGVIPNLNPSVESFLGMGVLADRVRTGTLRNPHNGSLSKARYAYDQQGHPLRAHSSEALLKKEPGDSFLLRFYDKKQLSSPVTRYFITKEKRFAIEETK